MAMGRVFCLLGKSGAGKDTLLECIIKDRAIALTPVVTYTTRPMREGEEDGVHYHFVCEDDMRALARQGKIIESREYHSVHGVWYYFTAVFDLTPGKNYIIITTPQGAKKLAQTFGYSNVALIYLKAGDRLRLTRSIAREGAQSSPNYSEVCRRYLADEEDFAELDFPALHTIDGNRNREYCLSQFRDIYNRIAEHTDLD